MRNIIVFSSDVEEILEGDIRTVSMYIRELNEVVEVAMNKEYMTLDEGIQILIEKIENQYNIKITYLTDATLVIKKGHLKGSKVQLLLVDEDTNKKYEVNFSNVLEEISLMNFIERHRLRISDMLKRSLKVDVVKIVI